MKLFNQDAELFIPDNVQENLAIKRTTHLCIAAHADDTEMMAYNAISECYCNDEKWFTSVIITDGAGSPRSGAYQNVTNLDMIKIRKEEQKEAAILGRFSCQFLLSYTSGQVKSRDANLINELKIIIEGCNPEVLFIHNLADKHDTHVASALNTIEAVRMIPRDKRPKKIYCMEVWRSLDWLCDEDKTIFNASKNPELAEKLINCFKSQIDGGKRYDLAILGRRLANATFLKNHDVDEIEGAEYGLDITDFINNDDKDPLEFISYYIDKFKNDVVEKITKMKKTH